jgi:hypothetical protein
MVDHRAGYEDTAGIRQGLEPGGDVDSVTVKIATLDHYVTEIDANSQSDPPILGQICMRAFHSPLQLDSAFHGIHSTGELD